MRSGSFKINQQNKFINQIYLANVKQDLALSNQQWLIRHKTQLKKNTILHYPFVIEWGSAHPFESGDNKVYDKMVDITVDS